jgi:hypothetical protein
MQKSTQDVPEAAGGAPEPMEEVVEEAAVAAGGEGVITSPKDRSGGGYPLPGDPGRRAHPLCANDGGHRE